MIQFKTYYREIVLILMTFALVAIPVATPIILLSMPVWLCYSRADERIPFGASAIMIVVGGTLLYLGKIQPANQFGNYAFYLFIIGTIHSICRGLLTK